jgi:uncharacterized protein YicC (UPF0701 family)
MTAYASLYKRKGNRVLRIILRSLNFKYLDIYIHNLPIENILLEEKIKKEIKKKILRGKIEVFILYNIKERGISINENILLNYLHRLIKLTKKYNSSLYFDIAHLFNLPGVISRQEKRIDENFIISGVREGIHKLIRFKEREGRLIKKEINKNLKDLEKNIERIKKNLPYVSKKENNQEDIAEEISLISFYINELEKKINLNIILKGKSIDFLTQEILRELNSASSKIKNKKLAGLIIEAKNHLERVREQAQNIE